MRDRRKAPRYSLGAQGTVNPPSGGAGTRVVVTVISTTGCSIQCDQVGQIGKKCEVYFDWRDLQLGLQAQVVWRSDREAGLKFYSVDADSQRRLNELCKALLIKPPSASEGKKEETTATTKPSPPAPAAGAAKPSRPPAGKKNERRRVPRYLGELHAQLTDPASGETWSVTLVTISVLGGCMEGKTFPNVGAQCFLIAEWEGKRLTLQGDVVWKSKGQAGLKFHPVDEGPDKLLRQICASLRLQPLAPMPGQPG